MSDSESDHIRMLRETLKHFIAREAPRDAAAKWDKDNVFPRKVFVQLAELGVMGLTIPEAYGGSGRDILATMIVIEELSRRSLALAVPYIMAACYAGMNERPDPPAVYRRSDGRWSNDPTVQGEQMLKESDERHRRWQSDCRSGRGNNPHCP